MHTDPLFAFCRARLEPTLRFLREMVDVNSFTTNAAGVNALAELTATHFAPLGFQSRFFPASLPEYGNHLVLECIGSGNGPTIALVSHLDTVFTAEEEARNDFRWRQEGRRIHGPGTNDIKGGTALIRLTLEALREAEPALFDQATWFVLLDASEETESADFATLCRAELPRDTLACLLFEADGGDADDFKLVAARKGRATFRVEVEGRAAHAGGSHAKGINAIVELAQVIQGLASLTDYTAGVTVNVGKVEGGTVINRVPHFASAELELRAFSSEAYRKARESILAFAGIGSSAAEDGARARITVTVEQETPPWPRNPESERLMQLWQRTATELGFRLDREERGGLSDGNLLWNAFPTLDGLGPRGENSHCSEHNPNAGKEQEWVDAESFVPKAVINARALVSLIRESGQRGS